MPHLTLEYTDNLPKLNVAQTLLELNHILMASGQFEEIDIKSRAILLDTFLVGTSPKNRAYAHVKLAMMSGRSSQIKRELSESILLVLKQIWKATPDLHIQLCIEVQDIDREVYTKTIICV